MKDILVRIRIEENMQFTAEKELIKYLMWQALINGRTTYLEEAFNVDSILVESIDEVGEGTEDI